MVLCECGCGKTVKKGRIWIKNHNWRGKHQSAEHRKKIGEAQKGRVFSIETRKKMSEAQRGEKNRYFGKHLSADHRKKISESNKGKIVSAKTKRKISEWHKRKNLSIETRKKISETLKGRVFSSETKKRISEAVKKRWQNPEYRNKMSNLNRGKNNPNFGKCTSAETRMKMSKAHSGEKNHMFGIPSPMKGKHLSAETKRKISEAQLGEKNHMFGEHSWNKDLTKETDAIVRRISEANRGKHLSAEAKKKIGNANRGKKRLDVRERNLKNNPMHSIEARVKSKKTHKELYLNKKNHPRYGLIHSDETKDKISASQKRFYATPAGEKNKEKLSLIHQGHNRSPKTEFKAGLHASPKTEFKKGHIPWILGKKGLIIGYKFPKGEKNPNWNNGSSFEPYSPEFNNILKRQINERDNFTCQNPNCDHACAKLCVHHIDYVKENCDQSNLITLCISCNTKANYDRPFWKALYSRIVQDRIKETKLQIQLVEIK